MDRHDCDDVKVVLMHEEGCRELGSREKNRIVSRLHESKGRAEWRDLSAFEDEKP